MEPGGIHDIAAARTQCLAALYAAAAADEPLFAVGALVDGVLASWPSRGQ